MRRLPALTLCAFLLCLQAAAQTKTETTPLPKPVVSVSFARQSIREDDSVQVQVWLANESNQDLTEVRLHAAAPQFIRRYDGTCRDWEQKSESEQKRLEAEAEQALELGAVPAHTVHSRTLCLRSGSNIVVGDFNLLFTFEYGWQSQGLAQRSFVVVEKTLKASLLGSDNIAGIPVGLAGFIVPGLFFWLVVTVCKVPWLPWKPNELALGDRLIYSVLISIFIVVVGSCFDFSDLGAGLGLVKLGYLALAGALFGAAVGGLDRLFRFFAGRRRKRLEEAAEARLIKLGEDHEALLDKLLDTYPGATRPRAVVTLKNGKSFRGSLARKDKDATALLGWFQVGLDGQPTQVADDFKALALARRWREALALARVHNLEIAVRDTIYETTGGADVPQEQGHRTWGSAEVRNVTNEDEESDVELISPQ